MNKELNISFDQINALQDGLRSARGNDGKSEWDDKKIIWLTNNNLLGNILDVMEGRSKIVKMKPLLEFTQGISIPRLTNAKFIAREKFFKNLEKNAPVRIDNVEGYYFPKYFIDFVEEPAGPENFCVWRLKIGAKNLEILAEFKNQHWALTRLAEIYFFMSLQGNGLPGILLVHSPNLFFVRGKDETIYSFCISGVGDYGTTYKWTINIEPINRGWYWRPGAQLITHGYPESYQRKEYPF